MNYFYSKGFANFTKNRKCHSFYSSLKSSIFRSVFHDRSFKILLASSSSIVLKHHNACTNLITPSALRCENEIHSLSLNAKKNINLIKILEGSVLFNL